MKPILETGAFELAGQIRRQERSSEEIVRAHINELRKWNPLLNAVVEERFAEALDEAALCDQRVKNGVKNLPPLYGVPFTMKEMISVEGYRHTLGSIHRRENVADRDATVVERMRRAGAILLGTTNVPELGFWFECANPVYGRTNNPFDLSRTAGGSTGGEAAAIATGGSPFGWGSDIGGSIRMPAAFCGIFGHKPSRRLVPLTGHFPVYHHNCPEWTGDDYPLTVIGPLARRAVDLYPLMELAIGPDGLDSETRGDFRLKPRITDWSGKTVWMMPRPSVTGCAATDPEISESVRTAARYFEAMGARLKEMRPDYFKDAVALWFASLSRSKKRSFTETLAHGGELSHGREILKILARRPGYTLPSLAISALELLSKRSGGKLEASRLERLQELERMRTELSGLLGESSILIMPVHPRVAPPHRAPLLRPFDFVLTAIINSLEFPATAVPMGLDEGLPVGIQVVAGLDQDHLTLSAAEALESAFGGWRKASLPS